VSPVANGESPLPVASPATATPDDLLPRVARGDERAFEALYDHGSAQVFGLVRRVLVDPAQAEEVAQEVWLQVWQTASRFDPAKGRAMTWVSTLAHRRAVDRVRSAQAAADRERTASFESAGDRPFDHVADSAVAKSEQRQVRGCLGRLTELQRRAVAMAYYDGLTYQQVGEALEIPLGTVKTRMRDGLIRLRDCLSATDEVGRSELAPRSPAT
jgi:RNA polymerase sigma-70 factor (ECF subfamily)